ncbi:exported protein of unknown function [Legionella longbeachae NSW150]|uniref:Uncharacterized protein n=1 Tax=Legionella longbeachae serogroup 1 (strain NSW150) TaxID=661367 RepID=D3HK94_LEGLN|nr:exported protein of unknown function [Legionella longbeachae NSW150]
MNILDSRFYSLSFILFMLFQSSVSAAGNSISLVGNQGYDLVTYQKKKRARTRKWKSGCVLSRCCLHLCIHRKQKNFCSKS